MRATGVGARVEPALAEGHDVIGDIVDPAGAAAEVAVRFLTEHLSAEPLPLMARGVAEVRGR